MNCPECDRAMSKKTSSSTRGSDGITYDWTKFHCSYDNVWVEQWIPEKEEEES